MLLLLLLLLLLFCWCSVGVVRDAIVVLLQLLRMLVLLICLLTIVHVVQLVIDCLDDAMRVVVMHINSDWYKIAKSNFVFKQVC